MEEDYDEIYGDEAPSAPSAPPAPPPLEQWQQQQHLQQTSVAQQNQPTTNTVQHYSAGPGGPGYPAGDDTDFQSLFGNGGAVSEPAGPPQEEGQPAGDEEDDDDDFSVRLDTYDSGPPSVPPPGQGGPPGFRGAFNARPPVPQQRPFMPPGSGGRGEARPYLDATSATAQVGAPVWASGSGGRGSAGGGGRGMGTRQWRPQFVPLGATALEVDETLAFPEAAKPGQPIKLPGQNRVTADEYQEFTTLGQGGIFDLDLDRVVDAPWKQGHDISEFFNYGLNPGRWKAYAREVQQACAQQRLQEAVLLLSPSAPPLSADPDLPPELKTTLMAKGLITPVAAAFRNAMPPPAQPPLPRAPAPDSVIHLAGAALPP
mmetsp:Transcript_14568/g.44034  ORF Transcript_14568/g.44034 Transcript_14568/m.44034 type:complete len:372 (+) Transcript_14568:302-1417(+)|eukprot:CAMPEP_0206138292 /NCGR_PEP_ID=MMETSP1473-20131121/3204_1 /ASSEMBLY_ACC=CAM_ASM_001109 /TAXON_ID=1461547 /ORGANISM="Stichococcus sp, Strain RCC1054" /LENGTH=371 /DNA_ID=CAMNT_0053531665 /DNA_START=244 /DNA_END=1359 /DNA_ORIENTATION=-